MDTDQLLLSVPRHLDEPPKFFFWDLDVAMVCLGCLLMGILAGYFFTSAAAGLAAGYALQRAKAGNQRGYALHLLYWHLPLSPFKRTPPSCIREFIG